ncbi:hypothetical protein VTN77DRAFT_5837 [Rasamsonia byssochlamydoides]|uniref:uncharacterized protein n=1 Tax=Rasamsonia byssochlamydoides TaxID=89139 RepID=UPI0037446D84
MPPKTSRKRGAADVAQPPPKRVKAVAKEAQASQAPRAALNAAPTSRLDVFVFGEGSAGELGLGPKNAIDVTRPRLNAKLDAKTVGVVSIATGGMHAVALTHDNKVLTWGVNDNCALGRDTTWSGGLKDVDDDASDASDLELNPLESTPTAIPANKFPPGTRIAGVAAGDSATFVYTEDGLVYGWGTFVSNEGREGFYLKPNNELIKKQSEPMLIPGLKDIVQLSAGNNFCLALDSKGTIFSWGRGEQNQLGRRVVVDRGHITKHADGVDELRNNAGLVPGPVALPKRKKIVSIHAGSDHAFAIDVDGNTWAWGLNNFGQTGIAEGAGKSGSTIITPQRVPSLLGKKMKMIQGGSHHSIGITQTGECLVWGRIDGAQMGLDTSQLPIDDPKKVISSENGKPRILLEPTALPIAGCVYAAAGSDHNILVTAEGKAYSWGFNANYQCGQGSSDDVPIATLINNSAVREKKLCWAGAGGQFSMLAAVSAVSSGEDGSGSDGSKPVINGHASENEASAKNA